MNKERFLRLLNERILILDGGMGTMIQSFKLNEQDIRSRIQILTMNRLDYIWAGDTQ